MSRFALSQTLTGTCSTVMPPRAATRLLLIIAVIALGAAAANQPWAGFVAASAVLLMGVVAVRPDWATLAVIGVIYGNAAVVATTHHGVPGFVSVAFPLLLAFPLVYYLLVKRQPIVFTAAFPWLVGYFLVQLVSTVLASEPGTALARVSDFVAEGLILFLVITNVVRTESVLRRAVWVLLGVGALLGTLSLVQAVTGTYEFDYFGFAQVSEAHFEKQIRTGNDHLELRQGGPLGQFNRYGQIMLILIPLALFRARDEKRVAARVLAVGAVVLIATGGTLTYSRGTAVAAVLLFLAMLVTRNLRPVEIGVAVLAVLVLLTAFPRFLERLDTLGAVQGLVAGEGNGSEADGAMRGRMASNLGAIRVFADHPVVGVGPGLYRYYHREQAVEVGLRVEETRQAHNLYPGIAAETGLLGLLCFLGVVGATLWDLVQARRRWAEDNPRLASLANGFFFAIVAYLMTGIFLHLSYFRYFWLLMALSAAAGAIGRERERIHPKLAGSR